MPRAIAFNQCRSRLTSSHFAANAKNLSDLIHSLNAERSVFVNRLRLMSRYPHRLLVVTATLSQVKSPYPHGGANPNRITQSLIAVLAGLQVPFLCTETHELGEELRQRRGWCAQPIRAVLYLCATA